MPGISIIVPVYNVEKYLSRCVDSILAQTFSDFELIIVDDGSPDNCPGICDRYALEDKRIKVIHQKNAGQSAARNAGLDIMTGKYVMFVDSDNAVHPDICRILYEIITKENADISASTISIFSTEQPPEYERIDFPAKYQIFNGGDIFEKKVIPSGFLYSPCIKMYKRDIFDNLRFKEGIVYEDYQIMPYILNKCNKYIQCSMQLYFYYIHPENISIIHSPISEKKLVSFDTEWEHYQLYRKKNAEHAAFISAYRLFLKFPKMATILPDNKHLQKPYARYRNRYLPKILLMPGRYLSVKNKLIALSTLIPSKKLRSRYSSVFSNEDGFNNPNNLF